MIGALFGASDTAGHALSLLNGVRVVRPVGTHYLKITMNGSSRIEKSRGTFVRQF